MRPQLIQELSPSWLLEWWWLITLGTIYHLRVNNLPSLSFSSTDTWSKHSFSPISDLLSSVTAASSGHLGCSQSSSWLFLLAVDLVPWGWLAFSDVFASIIAALAWDNWSSSGMLEWLEEPLHLVLSLWSIPNCIKTEMLLSQLHYLWWSSQQSYLDQLSACFRNAYSPQTSLIQVKILKLTLLMRMNRLARMMNLLISVNRRALMRR